MSIRPEEKNKISQPLVQHPVFNNWNIVTKGWYQLCKSSEVKKGSVKGVDLFKQRVVVFRKKNGELVALDGHCPHMGVDLALGKVVEDRLQCFFHHWQFGEDGNCKHIPIQDSIPEKACVNSYAVMEKYGHIWVYPDTKADLKLLEVPELTGMDVDWVHGKTYQRNCHYHITMINGIDPQHLKTVHNIQMDMDIELVENGAEIEIELKGKIPQNTMTEKLVKWFLGDSYSYSMKYQAGCVAALTVMKNVKLWGKYPILPTLHMLFSYKASPEGKTIVNPIYLTKKRKGPIGYLISKTCLFFTKMAFYSLQGEDGLVYDNIRFQTQNLLPIDKPVARYIKYINQLKFSNWSQTNILRGSRSEPR